MTHFQSCRGSNNFAIFLFIHTSVFDAWEWPGIKMWWVGIILSIFDNERNEAISIRLPEGIRQSLKHSTVKTLVQTNCKISAGQCFWRFFFFFFNFPILCQDIVQLIIHKKATYSSVLFICSFLNGKILTILIFEDC